MTLGITTRQDADTTVVSVSGDIDVETAPLLRDALSAAIDSGAGGDVALDLAGTDFLDSSALGVLVGATKRLDSRQGRLVVVCDKPHLLRVFAITRLDQVIPVVATLEAATR